MGDSAKEPTEEEIEKANDIRLSHLLLLLCVPGKFILHSREVYTTLFTTTLRASEVYTTHFNSGKFNLLEVGLYHSVQIFLQI